MKLIVGLRGMISLVIASGCAKTDWIDRTLVMVDVTGTWYGTMAGSSGGMSANVELWLELEQAGSKVTGSIKFKPDASFGNNGPIVGTVSGDVFRYGLARGSTETELTVSGDEMSGRTSDRPISFRRVSSRPASQ